jgi:hypothetical protein
VTATHDPRRREFDRATAAVRGPPLYRFHDRTTETCILAMTAAIWHNWHTDQLRPGGIAVGGGGRVRVPSRRRLRTSAENSALAGNAPRRNLPARVFSRISGRSAYVSPEFCGLNVCGQS